MDSGLYKTITFVCFILIGVFLKSKIKSKDEKSGIKAIILNLALPATIFIALLGVKVDWSLVFLPIIALALNVVLFLAIPYVLPLVGIEKDSSEFRTARLLIPSLAPGLSCFPFVLEFLGENALAKVAMADLGNKIFVLVILYIVAMNWHYRYRSVAKKSN
ncbi:MAG: permease, partial [Bacteroidota bacterium]